MEENGGRIFRILAVYPFIEMVFQIFNGRFERWQK